MDGYLDRFFPTYVREKNEKDFQDLCQGNMSVNKYVARLVQLSHFVPMLMATKSQKTWKFLKGLRVDIVDCVVIIKPSSYSKALEHA